VKFLQKKSYWKSIAALNSRPVYSLRGIRAYDELQNSLQPESGKLHKTDIYTGVNVKDTGNEVKFRLTHKKN